MGWDRLGGVGRTGGVDEWEGCDHDGMGCVGEGMGGVGWDETGEVRGDCGWRAPQSLYLVARHRHNYCTSSSP